MDNVFVMKCARQGGGVGAILRAPYKIYDICLPPYRGMRSVFYCVAVRNALLLTLIHFTAQRNQLIN